MQQLQLIFIFEICRRFGKRCCLFRNDCS